MSETLFDRLAQHAQRTPDAPALLAHGRQALSYGRLWQQLSALVETLNGAGIGRGERVAIVLPNGPELATACLGVMACAVAAPVNPDYKRPEYEVIFKRLLPRALILLKGAAHPAREAAQALGMPVLELAVSLSEPAGVFTLLGSTRALATYTPGFGRPEDVALVLQTSGTTARPKVVPLSQRNVLASASNLAASLQLTAADRCLHFLPMFHIGGIVDVLATPLLTGGQAFCSVSFSAPSFFRDLETFRPSWTQAVPVMLEEMLANAPAHAALLANHSLRLVRSVSAPLAAPRMIAFEKVFNVPVIEIYGMTETTGVITSNPLPPAQRLPASVGVVAGTELRVLDSTSRQPLPAGQVGEVVVRGANVMVGYEDAPEDNARSFVDGWFHTGDLGYLDAQGYLFLTGRVKDMINRGGEKVSPFEVDQALLEHPAVFDAAAFAMPHPALGEDVAAVVVLKAGASASALELTAFLRERLAFFKIPKALHFAEKVTRAANGKLQRARLTEMYGALGADAALSRPDFVAPDSPVSRMLASVWSTILKMDDIGMGDDFFALGGDSLKAASLINALQQKFGETIYVSSVFDAPTLAKYEHYLQQHYPEVVARILGESMAPRQHTVARVRPEMVQHLESMIAQPLGARSLVGRKNPRAIFVLSPPRSGSTLLRAMLAGHPQLFAPPELYLLSYENLADRKKWFSGSHRSQLEGNVRALMQVRGESAEACQQLMSDLEQRACSTQEYYGLLQGWLGERILVDKTPAYAVDPQALERAEDYFENPIYIHLLRHPYGMIRSFEEAKLDQLWFPRLVGTDAMSLEAFPFERRQLAEMVWQILNRNILAFLAKIPAERQYQLRFEQVVAEPEPAMRGLCRALGLEYAPGMLNPQGDKKQRMTDGIHDVSRMIGDPKFHQHKKIEAMVADQWKSAYELDFLSDETSALAGRLGYTETVASVRGRTEIEI